MRLLALLLALLLAAPAQGQGADPAPGRPTIVMGVRVDTPPFAWRDEPNDSYLGFLVDLCVDAAARAGYPFEQVPITAADRIAFFNGARRDLDLLCDPTTLTLARLGRFAADTNPVKLEFSPILFVANGTYVVRKDVTPTSGPPPEAGRCFASPAAAPSAQPAAAAPPKAKPGHVGAAFVAGATSGHVLEETFRSEPLEAGLTVCAVEFASHFDAARAFCEGNSGLRYYFGDQDILRAAIARQEEAGGPCAHEVSPSLRSYEPYALVISSRTPGFRQDFVKGLYEIFHHDTVVARFRGNFDDRRMSPFLETLFRINRAPLGGGDP